MMRRYLREFSVAVALGVMLLVLGLFVPAFFRGDQLRNQWVSMSPPLVVAVGMTLVILCRHIDISVGSQFSLCGVVAGLLAKAGWPLPMVGLCTVALGAGLGAVNGVLVSWVRMPAIVVTLSTMVILRESLRWWREGEFVRNMPDGFQYFGAGQTAGQWVIIALALGVCLLFAWGLRYLSLGRTVYATGSDPEAARLAGIRPQRVVLGVFIAMGALTGLGALLNGVRFPDIDPNAGNELELQVIAAVVVGGVAISGGRGTLLGVWLGLALLMTISPALVFLKVASHWEKALQGTIILLAVASDAWQRRGR